MKQFTTHSCMHNMNCDPAESTVVAGPLCKLRSAENKADSFGPNAGRASVSPTKRPSNQGPGSPMPHEGVKRQAVSREGQGPDAASDTGRQHTSGARAAAAGPAAANQGHGSPPADGPPTPPPAAPQHAAQHGPLPADDGEAPMGDEQQREAQDAAEVLAGGFWASAC